MRKQCESQNTNPNHSRSRDSSSRSDNQTGSNTGSNRHSTSIKSDQTGNDQIGRNPQKRTSERDMEKSNQYKRIKTEKQDTNSIHYAHESK